MLALSLAGPLVLIAAGRLKALGLAASMVRLWVLADVLLGVFLLLSAWASLRRDDRETPGLRPDPAPMAPSVAVIIPAWNEGDGVRPCLQSVMNQSRRPHEVLVVDDGSSDGSIERLAAQLGVPPGTSGPARSTRVPHLVVLRKEHSGKADSLNRALACTRAEVAIVLDADTRLLPGAIEAVEQAFVNRPDLTAVGSVLIPVCRPSLQGRLLEFFQRCEYAGGHTGRMAWSFWEATLLISGACAAFRRESLLAAGGFRASSWTEDYEVMVRLHRLHRLHRLQRSHGQPCRVRVDPRFLAVTTAPSTLPSFLRQRRRWWGGMLETLLLHRRSVGDPGLGMLGVGHLVHDSLAVLQPLGLALLLLSLPRVPTGIFGVLSGSVGMAVLAVVLWEGFLVLARLHLYRHQVGRQHTSHVAALLEWIIRPFLYGPLVLLGQLWGILSIVGRRRSW